MINACDLIAKILEAEDHGDACAAFISHEAILSLSWNLESRIALALLYIPLGGCPNLLFWGTPILSQKHSKLLPNLARETWDRMQQIDIIIPCPSTLPEICPMHAPILTHMLKRTCTFQWCFTTPAKLLPKKTLVNSEFELYLSAKDHFWIPIRNLHSRQGSFGQLSDS